MNSNVDRSLFNVAKPRARLLNIQSDYMECSERSARGAKFSRDFAGCCDANTQRRRELDNGCPVCCSSK